MNYANEEDYIKAINDNPENRDYQLLFAEYLQEEGEDNLAEGWRVLIEQDRKPELWPCDQYDTDDGFEGWNWDYTMIEYNHSLYNLFPSLGVVGFDFSDLHPAYSTFFGAMQAAAVAYVRYKYDENYGKPVIHFVAYKGGDEGIETLMDCHFDWEEREGPNGSITRRPTLQSNHVSYTNLGYDPEERILIIQAITDWEPILVEIELEDGEAIGKVKARITSFESLPNNLCNVELTTEKEEKKQCTRCDGTGFVLSDEDRRIRPIDEHPSESAIAYECSNCNGKGVAG